MKGKEIDRLLRRVAQGDDEAFERLYEETKRGVYAFLYPYFRVREDVEDAMQTVYLKVKLNIAKYRYGTNATAWLLQIAKNHALNEIKKSDRVVYTDEIDYAGAKSEESSSGIMDLMQKTLSYDEQEIVTLKVLWGYKHIEIAKSLSCPVGTVTSKYKRAISKLKTAIKEQGL